MSFSKIINHSELDISRVSVSGKPRDVCSRDGTLYGRRIYLQYNHPKHGLIPLLIRTPKQKYTFGIGIYQDKPTDPKKYSASAGFDENSQNMLKFFQELQVKIVELLEENYSKWVPMKKNGKVPIRAILENDTYKIIKVNNVKGSDEEYPPQIKYNFPVYNSKSTNEPECTTQLFLSKTEQLTLNLEDPQSSVPSGSYAESVILCSLYCSSLGRLSATIEAKMVKVYPKKVQAIGYSDAFAEDPDEEAERPTTFPDEEAEFSD